MRYITQEHTSDRPSRRSHNRLAEGFCQLPYLRFSIFALNLAEVTKRKPPAERHALPSAKKPKPSAQGASSVITQFATATDVVPSADDSPDVYVVPVEHQHCECVEMLRAEVDLLKSENEVLKSRCLATEDMEAKLNDAERHVFSIHRVKNNQKLLSFYTGFSSFLMFMACFNFLHDSAKVVRTCMGSRTAPDDAMQHGSKPGSKPKLELMEQFFLVLVRLRLGLKEVDLADRFKVHPSTVSRTVTTWVNLMYHKFRQLPSWLSRRRIDKLMPPAFKQWYATTCVVIDCTEFFINIPSSLARQSATWSAYKNHNTVKCLIGIAPHGHVTFVSKVFEGSVSDRAITEQSGLISLLEHGDSIMADKGFDIQDLLVSHGVRLNIPPFRQGGRQMTPQDLASTKKIAAVRIHVERKMQRIKCFEIVGKEVDNTMFDILDQLIYVCAMLTNFQGSLVA